MKRSTILLSSLLLVVLFLVACGGGGNDGTVIYDVVERPTLSVGDDIPVPTGDVLLTVEGAITNGNVDGTAQFDLETLESLGLVSYDVDDPFAEQNIVFTGILMSDLLDVVGAEDSATGLELVALNDYSAEAKISDMRTYPVMFGLQQIQS